MAINEKNILNRLYFVTGCMFVLAISIVVQIVKIQFVQGDEYTIKWWKEKAIKRYSKLHEEGRLKPEKLFYADAIGLTWEEMKAKFLADVGR